MKYILGMIISMSLASAGQAQADKKVLPAGAQNIQKLCGCFEVEFKYAETFSPDVNYKFHERDEINGGLELVLPVLTTDKKMVLQHLLVISDSMIIKHWREDWTFENPTIWKYTGNQTWNKEQLAPQLVKDKWTQSVWEVSDAPRYQGVSEWISTDGQTIWQNTADAPLPRREYSVRSDYNILKRTNRLIINNEGWVHDQDNQKIIRTGTADKLLVAEKGINSYKRVDDKQCAAAKLFWEKNKEYWTLVRNTWDDYLASHSTVELKTKVDGKALHENLSDLAKDFATGKVKQAEIGAKIKTSLEKFMGHDKDMAGK